MTDPIHVPCRVAALEWFSAPGAPPFQLPHTVPQNSFTAPTYSDRPD